VGTFWGVKVGKALDIIGDGILETDTIPAVYEDYREHINLVYKYYNSKKI
jgi:hypothetical protein